MRRVIYRLALAALVLTAVAVSVQGPLSAAETESPLAQEERRNLLLGTWFGETPPTAGGRIQWIVDWQKDGTYNIQFRIFAPDGRTRKHMETGIWGVSGPVYFSATQGWRQGDQMVGTDTAQARFYDAYEILTLKPKLFEYRHYVTGTSYKVRKVRSGFQFPK